MQKSAVIVLFHEKFVPKFNYSQFSLIVNQALFTRLKQLRMLNYFFRVLLRTILQFVSPQNTFETLLLCKLAARSREYDDKSKATDENRDKFFAENIDSSRSQ